MQTTTYEMGYALGKHWAQRDATADMLDRVQAMGDGKKWVTRQQYPSIEFTSRVDPGKADFLGTGATPSAAFVAGFIDGARAIEPNR